MSHCNRAIHRPVCLAESVTRGNLRFSVSQSKQPVGRPPLRVPGGSRRRRSRGITCLAPTVYPRRGKIARSRTSVVAGAGARGGLSSAAHGPRSQRTERARGPAPLVHRVAVHVVTSPRAARAPSPARAPRCPRMRHYSSERVGRSTEETGKEKEDEAEGGANNEEEDRGAEEGS